MLGLQQLSVAGEEERPKLHSSLPAGLAKARRLEFLVCAGHRLEGSIPAFSATLATLLLRHNQLESVPGLHLNTSAVMLLDHNRLSCGLPADNASHVSASLVAVGNRILWSGSAGELPSYVLAYERDAVLWHKRDAALWLLGKLLIGFSALLIAFRLRVGCRCYVDIMQRWHTDCGMHGRIAKLTTACSLFIVSQVVGGCVLLMMVVGCNYYICRTLMVCTAVCFFRVESPCVPRNT